MVTVHFLLPFDPVIEAKKVCDRDLGRVLDEPACEGHVGSGNYPGLARPWAVSVGALLQTLPSPAAKLRCPPGAPPSQVSAVERKLKPA